MVSPHCGIVWIRVEDVPVGIAIYPVAIPRVIDHGHEKSGREYVERTPIYVIYRKTLIAEPFLPTIHAHVPEMRFGQVFYHLFIGDSGEFCEYHDAAVAVVSLEYSLWLW
jgi:hypothetical protein